MKKHLLLAFAALANLAMAQTYSNGGLTTGSTTNGGTAAPAGFTWSEVQNNTGNTTESNTTAGYGGTQSSSTASYFIADDFTIPAGSTWEISQIEFYIYQSGYTGSTSPYNTVRVNILDSDPSTGTATSVFGDDTTNRFASTSTANMYRVFNSTVPTTSAPGTTRQIWKVVANTPVTLSSGTYWIKYQLQNSVMANAGFLPPVTIKGLRGLPGFNGKQYDAIIGSWVDLVDGGNPDSAPDYPMDMPFVITFTALDLGLDAVQYDNRVRVYPNPAGESFKINTPGEMKISTVEVLDISGKVIKVLKGAEEYNISGLAPGVYTLKIKSNETTKITKLIKK